MNASCLRLWLIALGIWFGCTASSEIASASQFTSKECRQLYYGRWLKERPYKAVASAATQRSEACGFSSNYSSRQAAIDNALQQCRTEARKRKVPAKLCRIREVKSPSQGELPVQPSVSGTGETLTLKKFQTKYRYDDSQMKLRFGAVGRVSCPFATGTAFLIGQSDVFITSDHIFVSPKKKAKDLGRTNRCFLEFFYSQGRYKIASDSIIHGLRTTKSAYNFQWFDWAIGKLDQQVKDVRPLKASNSSISTDANVMMVSQGINDFRPRICVGKISSSLGDTSVNKFTTTCDTGPGASGGPVIEGNPSQSADQQWTAVGLTWGYEDPYWRQIGTAHIAIPLADSEIQKALNTILNASGVSQDDDMIDCVYPNGSKIVTTRALCKRELGPTIIDCRLANGSKLATTHAACASAGGEILP
jgi:V8-like Glu-specific endopeptidase